MQFALVPAFLAALVVANPVPVAEAEAVAVADADAVAVADADAVALAEPIFWRHCRACHGLNDAYRLADILYDLARQVRRDARRFKSCGRLPQFGGDINVVIQNIISAGINIEINI